ncbi:unnamed protein product [Haemonchus placei]|uniref:Acetamidase n=1 Tax=Haemonchus placei TaxID=6290 RepID=A0A0N4X4V8_HAEPC|nr:unnamed protein product [Haemonchus placei]
MEPFSVFMPLSSTQVEPARVIDMPTSVSYPVPLIDENSRTSVEYDFDAIFNHPQVMIRDREAVEKKLRVMVEAGKEKLMVMLQKVIVEIAHLYLSQRSVRLPHLIEATVHDIPDWAIQQGIPLGSSWHFLRSLVGAPDGNPPSWNP